MHRLQLENRRLARQMYILSGLVAGPLMLTLGSAGDKAAMPYVAMYAVCLGLAMLAMYRATLVEQMLELWRGMIVSGAIGGVFCSLVLAVSLVVH